MRGRLFTPNTCLTGPGTLIDNTAPDEIVFAMKFCQFDSVNK
jgi:hypothetical protein